ncbi:winged helix-turn-helix domain-containing protein, partial [Pontibacter brevis]
MAIPDYQTLMLPLLTFAGDKKEHATRDAVNYLSDAFNLTDEEREETIPSGKEPVIKNRTGWAITYFKKAQLFEATRRAHFKITPRGLDILASKPDKISSNFLLQFPEFREFKSIDNTRTNGETASTIEQIDADKTPEEAMDIAYLSIRKALAQELLVKIQSLPPSFFEKLGCVDNYSSSVMAAARCRNARKLEAVLSYRVAMR